MLDFASAFKRPFTEPKRYGLQAILSVFPIWLASFPFLWGYLFSCVKETIDGEEDLPEWTKWLDLLKNGILSGLVMLAYVLPGAIVTFISFPVKDPTMMITFFTSPNAALSAGSAPNPWVYLLGTILLLLGGYVAGAAIANAAREEDWKAAFAYKDIMSSAFTSRYLGATAVSLVLGIAVLALLYIVGMVGFLPVTAATIIIGALGALLGSYAGIVSVTLVAQAMSD